MRKGSVEIGGVTYVSKPKFPFFVERTQIIRRTVMLKIEAVSALHALGAARKLIERKPARLKKGEQLAGDFVGNVRDATCRPSKKKGRKRTS